MYPYPPKTWTDLWQAPDGAPGAEHVRTARAPAPADLTPLPGKGNRRLEPRPGDPDRLRGDPDPSPVQDGHGEGKPLPLRSQQGPLRDPAVVEGKGGGGGPRQPHLVLRLPDGKTRHPR